MFKTRGLIVAVAFLLAASATLVLYMYVRGVQETSTGGGEVSVVVSDQDIPAGTQLDDLMADGALESMRIPENTMVRDAVTSLEDLEGRETSAAILAGEQISTTRLRGSTQLPGGELGIPDGYTALSLPLESPRLAGGAIHQGDFVTVYATFDQQANIPAFTTALVPEVEVLKVGSSEAQGADSATNITLALKPNDARNVVHSQEQGSVWLSLLPPNQQGEDSGSVTRAQLAR